MDRRAFAAGVSAAVLSTPAWASQPGPDPRDFGAVGDGKTNDLAPFMAALRAAADARRPLRISQPLFLGLKNADDSIELRSGARLVFDNGSITYDYCGSPLLWGANVSDVKLLRPNIVFSGRMPLHLPPSIGTFFDQRLRPTKGLPGRELMATIGFYGCRNIEIISPRFRAATMAFDRLVSRCIVIGAAPDGSLSRDVIIRDFEADGFYMGIVAWSVDGLSIQKMRTKRWGQLNTSTYAWEAPAHPIYVTPLGASRNVVATDLIDEGQEVGPYYGAGSTSYKFTGVERGLCLARLHSLRSAGLLDFHSRDFSIRDLYWRGGRPEAIAVNKVIRGIPYSKGPGEFSGGEMRNVTLVLPDGMNDYPVALGGNHPANMDHCLFSNWTLAYGGDRQSSSTPLVVASMSNSRWENLRVLAPMMRRQLVVLRIDNGGAHNRIAATVVGPGSGVARIAAGKPGDDNEAVIARSLG